MPPSRRVKELQDEIATRLRPVCGHMPDAEFEAMIEEMAVIKYKYENRDREIFFNIQARWPGPQG